MFLASFQGEERRCKAPDQHFVDRRVRSNRARAAESRRLYRQLFGIPFKEEGGGYLPNEALTAAKSFALWPLSQAAQLCFGKDSWPDDVPAPQAWLAFDVDSIDKATAELESRGYRMLIKNKKEPGAKSSAISSRRKDYWWALLLLRGCQDRNGPDHENLIAGWMAEF